MILGLKLSTTVMKNNGGIFLLNKMELGLAL